MSGLHATAARTRSAPQFVPPVMRRATPQSRYSHPPTASLAAVPAVQRRCAECEREEKETPVQPRLEVGPVGDRYEVEADSIAAHVMAMREPGTRATAAGGIVQRACSACSSSRDEPRARRFAEPEEDEKKKPKVRARREAGPETIAASDGELTRGGVALPSSTRSFFESRMGRDLGDVRVHQGGEAHGMNESISARAFTYKNHIWLGANESAGPSFTMAHELAHVMQQTAPGAVGPRVQRLLRASSASPGVRRDGMGDVRIAEGQEEKRQQAQTEYRLGILPMLLRWQAAGLLSPPFRPADVDEIPPMHFSAERAKQMDVSLAGLPALALVAQEAGKAALTKPGPTLTLLRGGLGAATEVGGAVEVGASAAATGAAETAATSGLARAAGFLGRATPWAIAATILLTPTSTAERWADELNPITGRPYGGPEEYDWIRRLGPTQRRYIEELWRRRDLQPDTSLDSPADQEPVPETAPQPKTKQDPKGPSCISREVPRLGGHKRHDAYAEKVTGSKLDYFAATLKPPPPLAINYDGKTANSSNVWEVKVGHGWFFNPAKAGLRDLTLARWDAQAALGMKIASRCGFSHLWSVTDKWIAGVLLLRWKAQPPVLSISEK